MSTLYNGNTALPQGGSGNIYSINYPTSKTTNPKIIISFIGYEERDDMSSSSFKLSITSNTLTSFTVNALCLGSNRLYYIKIMYLSLDNSFNAFYCLAVNYNSLVNYFDDLDNS
jgi:hypothetical protein